MDPITGALVQQLYNTLVSEHKLWNAFQSQAETMKNKIQVMKSFQADTQCSKGTNEEQNTLKTILEQVRDLVYEADDFLLECYTRAAYEKITCLGCYTPRGIFFRCKAVRKVNDYNRKISGLENWLQKYVPIATKSDGGNSQGGTNPSTCNSPGLSKGKIVGLEKDTNKIIKYITRDENSSSIGIVGMGGLGKTTLASKVYNHLDVVDHFDVRIWISVTKKFSRERILESMLQQLKVFQRDDESVHDPKLVIQQSLNDDPKLVIQKSLNDKKYLIVMDGVWDPDVVWWREMSPYLPCGGNTKKSIIITTRNEVDAPNMGAVIHHAHKLNEEDSWTLFSDCAFHQIHSEPKFEEIAKVIVKMCEGHPLSIITVAGLLKSKTLPSEWEDVKKNFHPVLAAETSVQSNLQLSYDDLPARLKQCILSFSIYPRDREIDAEQLIYWWVGEGLVWENGKHTAIEEASQCLSELVDRCLVSAVKSRGYDGSFSKCKMHDLVRDLIIRISCEEAFSSFDAENKQKIDSKSRHLGYTSEMENKLEENSSKLRAFILMKDNKLPSLHRSGLATVDSLRVLDLSQNEQEGLGVKDLLQWLRNQKRLAYLNLRKLHDLKHLPKWIRKHQNLKILVIKECPNLKNLPSCVTTLQNLVVLDVRNCALENLPQGLGKLSKLEVLSGFKLGSRGKYGARFGDLKGLKELRELRIQLSGNEDSLEENEGELSELSKLKVLSIDTKDGKGKQAREKNVELVKKLAPPQSLIELYLMSYPGNTIPDWVTPTILPELLYLYIDDAPITSVSEDFWGSDEKVWKIKGLCFKYLQSFRMTMTWEHFQKKLKCLRYVEVSHCQYLQTFPLDVKNHDVWVRDEFAEGINRSKHHCSGD